ncbi:peptidoglycan-associated lipoprotein [Nonlabens ulvanivorans]|uniref:Peptidoglycan-associated lipoprotein n=1 Tax=Nonlabens ulvanivorans TaxID=906888 RepID=A0A090WI43_NONUL|nr:OmpA family protein [Nonlabens ulvanivorans]GAL76641.1 peptidoglycan-associated lipoprotein [Nonlabens ulvanivorans]
MVNDSIEKYRSYDILKDSLQIGDKLVFNNVIFYPGRHVLRESSFPVMDSIINSLLLHKKYEIEIQGHICCLSAGVYGRDMDTGQWNLSQARAEQVKRFLVKYGVAADRLTTIGKQANFKTGKGDFYDRRVEIHITGIREDD